MSLLLYCYCNFHPDMVYDVNGIILFIYLPMRNFFLLNRKWSFFPTIGTPSVHCVKDHTCFQKCIRHLDLWPPGPLRGPLRRVGWSCCLVFWPHHQTLPNCCLCRSLGRIQRRFLNTASDFSPCGFGPGTECIPLIPEIYLTRENGTRFRSNIQ